ncbi:MAG: efflux RND transporter permease subunit [Acidobacteriota bacterium]
MKIAQLSVRRPVATFMVYVSLLLLGAIAIYRIPLAFLPTLDWPEMWIWIPYPNSSPVYIEKNIIKPAEEMLSTLSGLKKIRSTAEPDSASFQLTFDWGKKLDMMRVQVDEKLDIARREMPDDVEHVYVFNFNTTDIPVVQARISAPGVDLSKNYDLLDKRIANKIRPIPGVAKVELNGVQAKDINIYLILDKIKEHGVDVTQLVRRLQGANTQMSIGKVSEERFHHNVRVLGNFDALELLENFQVNERGLKLKDVATITYEEPALTLGRHLNRQNAVALEAFKESSANTVHVARKVLEAIHDDIGKDPLLEGIDLFIWNDQAQDIMDSLNGLRNAGIIGGFLAIFVLYFFLRRIDATAIVSLAIPLSLVTASVVLFVLGKSFNILSMMGLMLGVGMLVDNAIVVLEAIYRKYLATGDPVGSSISGAKEVGIAVTCATMTTLIVFLPLIVGGKDELSVWLKEVGISIAITLICSLFVSLTLIPLMASKILSRKVKKETQFISILQDRYIGALQWTMRHRVAMLFIIIGVFAFGLLPFLAGWVDARPFSGGIEQDRLGMRYEFFDYFYKSQVEEYVSIMEDYLFEHQDEFFIESVYSYFSDNDAGSVITFSRNDLSEEQVKNIRDTIRKEHPVLPGAKIGFWNDDDDSESPIERVSIHLYGDDTEFLAVLADEAVRMISRIDGMEDVRSSIVSGKSEVKIMLNKELASKYGLSP